MSTNNVSKKIDLNVENKYLNKGFALVYNDQMNDIKHLEARSLNIYHKSLKKKSFIKITNPQTGDSLIAQVISNKITFSNFYNSILSLRIAEELNLDSSEPYVEIKLISNNSTFISKKAKTFDEEREVAEKAPIDGILINDLNVKKIVKKKEKKIVFSYSIKVADFYFKDTAIKMNERIKNEALIKDSKIIKLSATKFRVLIGPFSDIKSLKNSFEKMNSFDFENLEILKNV